jgi:hypothetical protein
VVPEQDGDPDLFAALTALAAGGLIETPGCPNCRRPLTPSDLAHGYTAHPACGRVGT